MLTDLSIEKNDDELKRREEVRDVNEENREVMFIDWKGADVRFDALSSFNGQEKCKREDCTIHH